MATILHDIINTAYLVLGIRKITLYPSVSIENIQVLTACSHPHIPIWELIERTYPFLIGLRQWNDAEMMRREKKTEYAIIRRCQPKDTILGIVHTEIATIHFIV